MGCNIHGYVEVNRNGRRWEPWLIEPYLDRDYRVFAKLANVRNYGEIEPIAEPRGFPENISNEMQELYESLEGDAHSMSWVTAQELLFGLATIEMEIEWHVFVDLVKVLIRFFRIENVRFVFFFDN